MNELTMTTSHAWPTQTMMAMKHMQMGSNSHKTTTRLPWHVDCVVEWFSYFDNIARVSGVFVGVESEPQ